MVSMYTLRFRKHPWASILYDIYLLCTRAERPQEPPPAIPYQGQIYSEVEKTGLFAKKESDSTSEEPQYGSTQFPAIDKEPQYSTANASTQALNEEHQYDTTFRGVSTATKSNEEPHYSTAIRTVPSNTATQVVTILVCLYVFDTATDADK